MADAGLGARLRPRWCRWLPVWRRNLLVWRKLAVASLIGNFGEPLLYLLALGYGLGALVGEVGGLAYPHYLASGIVCSSAMMTASFEGTYSAYSRMAVQRSWDAIVTAPLAVADVVSGEIVWAATKSVISASAILLVAAALGAVAGPAALLVLPIVLICGLCFAALAMVVTALARSYDFFLYYSTLVVTPMLLLSGVFFPLEQMPPGVQHFAALMPLSHAVALVRPLVVGGPLTSPGLHLAVIATIGVVAWLIAVGLVRRRLEA